MNLIGTVCVRVRMSCVSKSIFLLNSRVRAPARDSLRSIRRVLLPQAGYLSKRGCKVSRFSYIDAWACPQTAQLNIWSAVGR